MFSSFALDFNLSLYITAAATRTVMTPVTVMLPEVRSGTGFGHDPIPPRPTTPLVTMMPSRPASTGGASDQPAPELAGDASSSWADEICGPAMSHESCPLSVVLEPKRCGLDVYLYTVYCVPFYFEPGA